MSLPIRLRLSLWYMALLTGTLILFGGALYAALHYSLYSEVDRSLRQVADEAVRSLRFAMEAKEQAIREGTSLESEIKIQSPTDAFAAPSTYVEVRINGMVADKSRNLGDQTLPVSAAALQHAADGESYLTHTYLGDDPISLLVQPVRFQERVVYVVAVGRSIADVQASLDWLAFFIVTGSMLTLLLAAVPGLWLAERAIEPVDAVTQAALRISRAEDLSRRLTAYQPMDEIGRLIGAFNEMLGRLDDVFRDQQRFVADVSHELRTPLTVLQGNLDLLKRGALDDPEGRQESLEAIESEVARLNRLVADLLLLARLDGGEKLVQEPVELDTLLLEVFRQGQILASASGRAIRFRLGHEDQATVLGDPDRLRQLLLNLVDNAIKYTHEGEVVLSLWKNEAAGEVRVSVQDTGIGIPQASIPLLFHRFYRADRARSRQLDGTGLGLAIVQWIVRAHEGTVAVDSQEGKGSIFTVTLPLPTQETLA
ncbi:MAG: HAMP domain-containing histidine kinase, partial [Chloroflexota bacterium]|nr:HAMP domain-containing histidine kinase [Chloroflexota bacterium]